MDYKEACGFLKSTSKLGSRPGLDNIRLLCARLGDPQEALRFIHVAGTNGKGSTCAMAQATLTAAGYKTGMFISPYLESYLDSFNIDGVNMTESDFAGIVSEVSQKAEAMAAEGMFATEFEVLTACAFLWFAQNKCDIVVLETGMGGREDATNIITNTLVSIITAISIDHINFLGDTIEEITRQKCGIIKQGGITVCYPDQQQQTLEIVKMAAAEKENFLIIPDIGELELLSSDLNGTKIKYRNLCLHISMPGRHQALNAITAIETINALRSRYGFFISDEDIISGINNAYLPARQEVLHRHPLILLDGSHNIQGIMALADTVKNDLECKYISVIMGMLKDKQYEQPIEVMARLCGRFIAVTPDSPRALAGETAAKIAGKFCADVAVFNDASEALAYAAAPCGKDGAIVICGSLYLAAKMRREVGKYVCQMGNAML